MKGRHARPISRLHEKGCRTMPISELFFYAATAASLLWALASAESRARALQH